MLLACGDALIDFVPTQTADGRDALNPVVGGSCLNVAIGLARLGARSGFVGGIATDTFGQMIADHAAASKVDLGLATRSDHPSTLAFARLVAGHAQYAFYDAGTAAANWVYRSGAIPFGTVEAVHIGSTTLVTEPGATETMALIADARATSTIVFDPNCRPSLVNGKESYRARMMAFAEKSDVVKLSEDDFAYLFGEEPQQKRAEALLEQGTALVVITRGEQGAVAWHASAGRIDVAAPKVAIVDTIGAGDSFQAGLLFALHRQDRLARARLKSISDDALRRALTFAAGCAAITCTRTGADPPWHQDVADLV